jgi:aryl-alcohol dehydrogenase
MTQIIQARAALVRDHGAPLRIEPVDIDAPRATEVRIRMVGCGICHTDIVFQQGQGLAVPCLLGHEGSGVVDAVGAEVSCLVPGDHVVRSFLSCGTCPSCAKQKPASCYHFAPLNYGGSRSSDGSSPVHQDGSRIAASFFNQSSFATYAIADQRNAVKVPKDIPLELLGPLGCGIQTGAGAAMNSLGLQAGETLAIFGGGAVGLSALLGAIAVDAGPVIIVEPNEARGQLSLELGAAHVINPIVTADVLGEIRRLGGGGVNHGLDTTGIPEVIAVAGEAILFNGMLGLLGVPPMEASLPLNMMSMMARGIGVKAIVEGDSDPQRFIPHMIDLYRAGRFPFDRLIVRFPFEQINEAIDASKSGAVIKPVLIF